MGKSPEELLEAMLANIPEKTGKPLTQWMTIISSNNFAKHGEIVKFLKTEHGITHGFANLIANRALGGAEVTDEQLIDAQYAGAKANLRPIYEAIISLVKEFGDGVEFSAKKTCMSLRRSKQFALIQPSTKTRVDLGLNLKDMPASKKLELSGSFNAMVSHRVKLTSIDDVDDDVRKWLHTAWENAQ